MKAPENSKKPPSVIYLQAYGDDMTEEEIAESDFSEILLGYDCVSWCVSKQYNSDIEYTRSDLCMSKNDHEIILQAQTDLYEGIVARLKLQLENAMNDRCAVGLIKPPENV